MKTLIVPGVQKGGTSTLYSLLAAHPQVLPSRRTETEYFSHTGNCSAEDYAAYFENFDRDWRLDVSPGYFISPHAPAQIASVVPDARFVFVFRDPVMRAWSAWKMQQTKGSDLKPFNSSIQKHAHYVEHGRYATQLKKFLDYFPQDQMLFLRSEDLETDPQALYARLCTFLSIDPFPMMSLPRENLGGFPRSYVVSWALNQAFRMRNMLRESPLRGVVTNQVVDRSTRRIRNSIAAWNRHPSKDTGPDAEAVHYLDGVFADELDELTQITGLDFASWRVGK